ncbi:Planctomycete cytochrome C [Rubinisphaera italica]|uniref:Planctomycete cytochrome C n=2 Tax=Rubinisphaera italica TaxID=2527969 RepID=A0A5C5XK39_9PLAN|nr:Planctomycete cytochrome C [Rubinisphaera italica]
MLSLLAGTGVAQQTVKPNVEPNEEQLRFFETKIRPLLATHCYDCHGADLQESNLRLDTLQGMLNGGKGGPGLVPHKPQGSLLVTAVSYRDSDLKMPPEEKLAAEQIADLTRWIEMGAPHPDSGSAELPQASAKIDLEKGREHWAFQPPVKPNVPSTADTQNPIDAFLQQAMSEQGLTLLKQADKRTLIRRASFDLIGLPPTPEDVDHFLADESADAFEKVVDRLLASPHYGERWGRHWLDIVRYADSNGLDENVAHGNAWRYRDYVVESFNQDKPYDQFLREQLAGDLIDSGDDWQLRNERLIATGFLVLGPKVLAEVDETKMEMDIVDEQLDTIGRGILGLTLGCARCHDHKFDPIGHADYYAMAGILKSTRAMQTFTKVAKWNENSIASPIQVQEKAAHEKKISDQKKRIEILVEATINSLPEPTGETDLEDPEEPEDVEKNFPEEVQSELKSMRDELKNLETSNPQLPTAMGVQDGEITDVPVHLRGSHLTLGEVVQRRFPLVLAGLEQVSLPKNKSGRLEFAQWLTQNDHPLTARVIVNRLWRWHFGKGIVGTVDNFGLRGEQPSHPELLDWLAISLVESNWSIKTIHRTIMLSAAYQRESGFDSTNTSIDPANKYYWKYDLHRLDAETIRDSMLAVSGTLDLKIGGSLLPVENRAYFFNHTSEDKASYENIRRRSIYVPVVRNHLYDFFQLFDYTDASVLNGNRETSTIAPQALMLMNSELIAELSAAMADRILQQHSSREGRINYSFNLAYSRPPSAAELQQITHYLNGFDAPETEPSPGQINNKKAWQLVCQSLISSSEFLYVQ